MSEKSLSDKKYDSTVYPDYLVNQGTTQGCMLTNYVSTVNKNLARSIK